MAERPILFSGPMVRAILDGRKTQTRRIVKAQKRLADGATLFQLGAHFGWAANDAAVRETGGNPLLKECPYGAPGDRLWVRETFAVPPGSDRRGDVAYRADLTPAQEAEERSLRRQAPKLAAANPWTPSIHMPRWASRITLEITDVRVERLQDISEEDTDAEGVGNPVTRDLKVPKFAALWDQINGKTAPWDSDPWVWVVSFRRQPPAAGGEGE